MLNRVIKVYKGTPTAKECKAALDRAANNLPLFSDRPLVVAQPGESKTSPSPAPPAVVVDATPEQHASRAGPGGPGLAGQSSLKVSVVPPWATSD